MRKFVCYEGTNGKWRWKAVATNGQIVGSGESDGYSSLAECKKAIARMKKFGTAKVVVE